MKLGETIKALRDEKRLSMRGLAKAVDVTPMHISNIEKGFTTGSSELIAKIARVLETDVDSLLHMADRVDPEVVEVIQQNPQAVPSFLRSAKDLSADDWKKLQTYLEKLKRDNKSGRKGTKKKAKAKKSGK
jgi:transcriptional regulator with XRE-family HTH domain